MHDRWHLTFSNPDDLVLDFKSDIRPIFNVGESSDYNQMTNKPRINGVELYGDKTNEELNISSIENSEIEELLKNFV